MWRREDTILNHLHEIERRLVKQNIATQTMIATILELLQATESKDLKEILQKLKVERAALEGAQHPQGIDADNKGTKHGR